MPHPAIASPRALVAASILFSASAGPLAPLPFADPELAAQTIDTLAFKDLRYRMAGHNRVSRRETRRAPGVAPWVSTV